MEGQVRNILPFVTGRAPWGKEGLWAPDTGHILNIRCPIAVKCIIALEGTQGQISKKNSFHSNIAFQRETSLLGRLQDRPFPMQLHQ